MLSRRGPLEVTSNIALGWARDVRRGPIDAVLYDSARPPPGKPRNALREPNAPPLACGRPGGVRTAVLGGGTS